MWSVKSLQSCPILCDPMDGSSRQEYWSGLPCPPPGDLSNPGIKPASFASPALAGGFFTLVPTGKPKPIACTILKVNSCELWVIARHQCRFISCNKCTPLVYDVDNGGIFYIIYQSIASQL